jgi:septal ring factor EnvC (AmiA/AmiB activator)
VEKDRRKPNIKGVVIQTLIVAALTFFTTVALNWSVYEHKISTAQASIHTMEITDKKQDNRLITLETELKSWETFRKDIRDDMKDIRADIKELLKRR